MIKEVGIENYKSIQELKLELGRVTVLIGENGCGKTNILEAIALSSAAAADKLDNEFLASRGIRVTDSQFMRSAFNTDNLTKEIKITLQFHLDKTLTFNLQHDGKPYSNWVSSMSVNPEIADKIVSKPGLANIILKNLQDNNHLVGKNDFSFSEQYLEDAYQATLKKLLPAKDKDILTLTSFLIFSPENSSLRIFNEEGQIQPLGIKGEGLFKLLTVLSLECGVTNF